MTLTRLRRLPSSPPHAPNRSERRLHRRSSDEVVRSAAPPFSCTGNSDDSEQRPKSPPRCGCGREPSCRSRTCTPRFPETPSLLSLGAARRWLLAAQARAHPVQRSSDGRRSGHAPRRRGAAPPVCPREHPGGGGPCRVRFDVAATGTLGRSTRSVRQVERRFCKRYRQGFPALPLTVVEFHPDATTATVVERLGAAGPAAVPSTALPAYMAAIPTDRAAIETLAADDAVASIYPATTDLVAGGALMCEGLVSLLGLVAKLSATVATAWMGWPEDLENSTYTVAGCAILGPSFAGSRARKSDVMVRARRCAMAPGGRGQERNGNHLRWAARSRRRLPVCA